MSDTNILDTKADAWGVIAADGNCLFSSAILDSAVNKAEWSDAGWQASGPFKVLPLNRPALEDLDDLMAHLKPMATAPKSLDSPLINRVLVLDEFVEGGMKVRVRDWKLVYWCEAFDGWPAGWRGADWGDIRHPVGWLMALETPPASDSSASTTRGT